MKTMRIGVLLNEHINAEVQEVPMSEDGAPHLYIFDFRCLKSPFDDSLSMINEDSREL